MPLHKTNSTSKRFWLWLVLFLLPCMTLHAQSPASNESRLMHVHPTDNLIGATNGIVFEIYTPVFELVDQFTLLENPRYAPSLYDFEWSPDGSKLGVVISGVEMETGRVLQVWNMHTTQKLYEIPGVDVFSGIAWSPDGTRFAVQSILSSGRRVVHTYDAQSGQMLIEVGANEVASQLIWSAEGDRLVTDGWHDIRVWNADSGQLVQVLDAWLDNEIGLVASPVESLIAFVNLNGNETDIEVWDTKIGRRIQYLHGHDDQMIGLAWNAGGLVSTSFDDTLRIWDPPTGQASAAFQTGRYALAELSADGTWLLVRDGLTGVHVRDAATGEILYIFD